MWYNNYMREKLPHFLKPFFWSYDFEHLDKEWDKKRIVTVILTMGTSEATVWLFTAYTKDEIVEAIEHPLPGIWDKKSLNYWSLLLGVRPGVLTRNIS